MSTAQRYNRLLKYQQRYWLYWIYHLATHLVALFIAIPCMLLYQLGVLAETLGSGVQNLLTKKSLFFVFESNWLKASLHPLKHRRLLNKTIEELKSMQDSKELNT